MNTTVYPVVNATLSAVVPFVGVTDTPGTDTVADGFGERPPAETRRNGKETARRPIGTVAKGRVAAAWAVMAADSGC